MSKEKRERKAGQGGKELTMGGVAATFATKIRFIRSNMFFDKNRLEKELLFL